MSKRLPPVLELPETCSESSSPGHKRSKTQQKSRTCTFHLTSDNQVWQIIQSRRNLDKKIKNFAPRGQSANTKKPTKKSTSAAESPSHKLFNSSKLFKTNLVKKKLEIVKKKRENIEKNKENREKIQEKAQKSRIEVKTQYAQDLEFIKKRNEAIIKEKQQKASMIKAACKEALEKRKTSSSALKELNYTEYLNRIRQLNEQNKLAEASLKSLEEKQEILIETVRSKSVC